MRGPGPSFPPLRIVPCGPHPGPDWLAGARAVSRTIPNHRGSGRGRRDCRESRPARPRGHPGHRVRVSPAAWPPAPSGRPSANPAREGRSVGIRGLERGEVGNRPLGGRPLQGHDRLGRRLLTSSAPLPPWISGRVTMASDRATQDRSEGSRPDPPLRPAPSRPSSPMWGPPIAGGCDTEGGTSIGRGRVIDHHGDGGGKSGTLPGGA